MERVTIIAEAGVNHNGSLELAKKMIDVACDCKVDIIKFQTAKVENLVCRNAFLADYQKANINNVSTQYEMLQQILLDYKAFEELYEYCDTKKIQFLSTPFDDESIEFLNQFEMPFWKIPSGEITNYPYLLKIAKTKKPVVMSTGMSTIVEIEKAIKVLEAYGCNKIELLHCNTEYPTPMEDVNLNAMMTLQQRFDRKVGYSDHTKGIEVAIAAVALGAHIIEKHFTLDKKMQGPDHKASLEPCELRKMVEGIRNIEAALGNGRKEPTPSERKNITIARKSIVAKLDIKHGDKFSEDNLTTKRPGDGVNPMKWKNYIGLTADRDYVKDEQIGKGDT